MKPLVALAPQLELDPESYAVRRRYADFIAQSGGSSVLISPNDDEETLRRILQSCDGLMLTGGADIEPHRYGREAHARNDEPLPERDDLEFALVRIAKEIHLPYLGICRGLQVLNVERGGTLYQHIEDEVSTIEHWQPEPYSEPSHAIEIIPETPLAAIFDEPSIMVNSMHHQAIETTGAGLSVAARDESGLIESLYDPQEDFFIGIQWHPEYAPQAIESKQIGEAFIQACATYHEERNAVKSSTSSASSGARASSECSTSNEAPSAQTSLTKNHALTADYIKKTQLLDPNGDDRRRTWDYLEHSTSIYDGITVYSSYLPKLFDRTTYDRFKYISETTYGILVKVVQEYIANPTYRSVFNYDKRYEELILLPSGYDEPLPLMRVDLFLDEDSLEATFCEFNSDGSSGMNENREITIGVQGGRPYQVFSQEHQLTDCNEALFQGWVDQFMEIYRTYKGHKEKPNIVIADYLDHAVVEEFKVYGRLFEQYAANFAIYDVRELEFDGETLRGKKAYFGEDNLPIDVIWRRCVSTDVIDHWDESQALIDALRSEKVALIGSFAGHIVHDKQIFEILLHPETKKILTAQENDFLEKTIPFTTALDASSDEARSLLDEIKSQPYNWVIKPNDSYGSQEVHIGLDHSQEEWAEIVEKCASKPDGQLFLAQRFCMPYPSAAIPLYGKNEDYELPPRVYRNLSGLYVFGGKFSGVFSRQGPQNIILGRKGGVTAPTIWVDVDMQGERE